MPSTPACQRHPPLPIVACVVPLLLLATSPLVRDARAQSAPPSSTHAQSAPGVGSLRFLAGCWELRRANRVTHEQWMAPLGGMMIGMSRTVVTSPAGERVREWEVTRIELRDGVVTYAAQPGGVAPTFFPATSISDSSVTFANAAHDFPQRIRYTRRGADSLLARIEGEQGGDVRGIDFPYARVPCAGAQTFR
ncbi:MAG TPA: DUF6265 family protein [Gemmatimonadaceae bacterium]|nr:DUF6265 family protein [Gemmatimonadaceae bacterium]